MHAMHNTPNNNWPHTKSSVLLQVYLFAKNDFVLLPHAVQHYRTRFPGCHITVFDNNSTDGTAELAEKLGCPVRQWHSEGSLQDNVRLATLKGECWKFNFSDGRDPPWVVAADVDEWLDMWQTDLDHEDARGSMIIKTQGFAALGTSATPDLSDILICTASARAH